MDDELIYSIPFCSLFLYVMQSLLEGIGFIRLLVLAFTLFLLASLVSVCNAVSARRNWFHSTSCSRNNKRVNPFSYKIHQQIDAL